MIPIVSVIKDSFQEYEGYHSLVLYCFGCNMDCNYCCNKAQITDKSKIIGDVYEVLEKELNETHEAVVLLGGEFLIYPIDELTELCKYIKAGGRKVKLYTNGIEWITLCLLITESLIDEVSIDLKAVGGKYFSMNIMDYLSSVIQSLKMLRDSKIPFEIRTTIPEEMSELELSWIVRMTSEITDRHILTHAIKG